MLVLLFSSKVFFSVVNGSALDAAGLWFRLLYRVFEKRRCIKRHAITRRSCGLKHQELYIVDIFYNITILRENIFHLIKAEWQMKKEPEVEFF